MRTFKTVMAIAFGSAAFFFFFMSFKEGIGQVPSMVLFAICVLITFAFGRKTAADRERIARQRQKAAAWANVLASFASEPAPEHRGDPLKKYLVGAVVLQVLAFPFLVLKDLMEMQK